MPSAINLTNTITTNVSDGDKVDSVDFGNFFEDENGVIFVEFIRVSLPQLNLSFANDPIDFNLIYKTESNIEIESFTLKSQDMNTGVAPVNGFVTLNSYIQNGTMLSFATDSNNVGEIEGNQTLELEMQIIGRRAI